MSSSHEAHHLSSRGGADAARVGASRIAQAALDDASRSLKSRIRTIVRKTGEEWRRGKPASKVGEGEGVDVVPDASGEDELVGGQSHHSPWHHTRCTCTLALTDEDGIVSQ